MIISYPDHLPLRGRKLFYEYLIHPTTLRLTAMPSPPLSHSPSLPFFSKFPESVLLYLHIILRLMKRILVTGGAGFIGSHLCERLLDLGHEVICLDNYFTGSKMNIIHLLNNPYFELVRHDVTMPIFIETDEIYNLACPASPIHYQYNGIKTIKTSVMGAINTLGLAKRTKSKILQASTSEIYGDPEVHPQTEDYWGNVNTLGPRACYDEGKRCAETLFMNYHHQNGVRIKIARIFNTYGPKMNSNDGRVVSNFIVQALKGEDITIYGDGSHTRSFQYIDDLVDGLIKLMDYSGFVYRSGEYWKPCGDNNKFSGTDDNKDDGLKIQNCLPPSSTGRSETAQTRYLSC